MDAATEWNDRRDLLAQIGIMERQLAEATKQRNKLAKALRGLVGECEYQSKAGDFNADRIELSAARIALAALNQPGETKP